MGKQRGRPKGSKSSYTVSEKALAQRKKNGREIVERNIAKTEEEYDYNARQIQHTMKIAEIAQHADRKDINSLKSCFANYLMLCQEDGFKVGNLAACAALGIDHSILNNWAKNDRNPEYQAFAKLVKSTCSLIRENLISDQKINPVIGIFWQRNYDGLRNDTEQIQAINEQNESDTMTGKDYIEKYGKLLDE